MTTRDIISRTSVIPGAENDDFHVDGLAHCEHAQPVHVSMTFDSAGVRGLDTPVDLVDPVPGKKLVTLGVYYSKETSAYGGGAAVEITYKGSSLISTIPQNALTNSAAVTGWATRANLSGTPDGMRVPDLGIEIKTGTAFTGSGGDLTITLIYLETE